ESILPENGSGLGGTAILIVGSGLTDTIDVTFGGDSAQDFFESSDSILLATCPSGTGVVDVVVTTSAGDSNPISFRYGPSIEAIDPTHGPALGGTETLIVGSGLAGATGVKW